jgi:hypothetical protein
MMQMAIVQIVDVVVVAQGLMAAARTMMMIVVGMGMAILAHQARSTRGCFRMSRPCGDRIDNTEAYGACQSCR